MEGGTSHLWISRCWLTYGFIEHITDCSSLSLVQRLFVQCPGAACYLISPPKIVIIASKRPLFPVHQACPHPTQHRRLLTNASNDRQVSASLLYGEAQRRPWPSCERISVGTNERQ